MIGFNFPENFNNPYISQSITEFWRRWHMTLGRFMREYLYIPLGGNRVALPGCISTSGSSSSSQAYGMARPGTFIAWGAFHGLFLVADRLFLLKILEKIGKFPAILFTFFISLIGWVLFRAETLTYALELPAIHVQLSRAGEPVELTSEFMYPAGNRCRFLFHGGIQRHEAMAGESAKGRRSGEALEDWGIGRLEDWGIGGLGMLVFGRSFFGRFFILALQR